MHLVESGLGGEQREAGKESKQAVRVDAVVNGGSRERAGEGAPWEGPQGDGAGHFGEESNWFAQYLEGMLASPTTVAHSGASEGDTQKGNSTEQAGSEREQERSQIPTDMVTSTDDSLNELLAADQCVDVDIDIGDEELPSLEAIGRQFGLEKLLV